jgi:hypothetical protein
MPHAVNTDDKGFMSVNYIQVLVAKLQNLEKRLKQLEYMAFSSLLSNQMVYAQEELLLEFTLNSGKTNPGGTQMMTKAMAFDMYNLAVTASTNGIADNQLIKKFFGRL